jgi:hypothetical protein
VTIERVVKEYARIAFLIPQDLLRRGRSPAYHHGRLLSIKDMPRGCGSRDRWLEEEVIYGSDGEGGKHDIGRLKKIRLTGKIPALEGLGGPRVLTAPAF